MSFRSDPTLSARGDVGKPDDPDTLDLIECCHCRALTADDLIRSHGDDFDLCPKCSDEFVASVMTCHHFYEPGLTHDEHGDEGRICRHCGCFVDRDLAMLWAPLICDGFVDVENPSP